MAASAHDLAGTRSAPVRLGTVAERWRAHLAGGITGAPIIQRNRVLAASFGGDVGAFDLATGRQRWLRPLGTATYGTDGRELGFFGGLALAGDRVIVASDRAVCLSVATGATIWEADPIRAPGADDYFWAPPAIVGRTVLLGSGAGSEATATRGRLTAYSLLTGALLWSTPTVPETGNGGGILSQPTVDVFRRRVYAATGAPYAPQPGDNPGSDSLLELRLSDGAIVWADQVHAGDQLGLDLNSAPVIIGRSSSSRARTASVPGTGSHGRGSGTSRRRRRRLRRVPPPIRPRAPGAPRNPPPAPPPRSPKRPPAPARAARHPPGRGAPTSETPPPPFSSPPPAGRNTHPVPGPGGRERYSFPDRGTGDRTNNEEGGGGGGGASDKRARRHRRGGPPPGRVRPLGPIGRFWASATSRRLGPGEDEPWRARRSALLDALGDRDQTGRGELDDGAMDVLWPSARPHERPVDLDDVDGHEVLEMRERRVPRTEVVDRELDAESLELGQRLVRVVGVEHDRALGDLEAEHPRRELMQLERGRHVAHDLGVHQLRARLTHGSVGHDAGGAPRRPPRPRRADPTTARAPRAARSPATVRASTVSRTTRLPARASRLRSTRGAAEFSGRPLFPPSRSRHRRSHVTPSRYPVRTARCGCSLRRRAAPACSPSCRSASRTHRRPACESVTDETVLVGTGAARSCPATRSSACARDSASAA